MSANAVGWQQTKQVGLLEWSAPASSWNCRWDQAETVSQMSKLIFLYSSDYRGLPVDSWFQPQKVHWERSLWSEDALWSRGNILFVIRGLTRWITQRVEWTAYIWILVFFFLFHRTSPLDSLLWKKNIWTCLWEWFFWRKKYNLKGLHNKKMTMRQWRCFNQLNEELRQVRPLVSWGLLFWIQTWLIAILYRKFFHFT